MFDWSQAEEKARQEAEKLHQEELAREKELAKNLINAARAEESRNEKRKRKKRKQTEEIKQEETNKSCDKSEDPNLVRVPPQGREDNDIKNNIKLQVKLSDAPLKSPRNCHGVQKTVKVIKMDSVKTQKVVVEPLQTNGKVDLKAIKKPDILKSIPVQLKQIQVTKGASHPASSSAKTVPEQSQQNNNKSLKKKEVKSEKDIDTNEKRVENGDVNKRKGKQVQNNNDIVINKNILPAQLNGSSNNNSKTVKKPSKPTTPVQPVKSSRPLTPNGSPSSPKKTDSQRTPQKTVVHNSPPQDQVCLFHYYKKKKSLTPPTAMLWKH